VSESNDFLRRISVLPMNRRVSLRIARLENNEWVEKDFRITLEGIDLVKKSDARKRKTPQVYIDMEIDRTFGSARAAMDPIGKETRAGTILVRGREPKPWVERYDGGDVEVVFDGKPIQGETATDIAARAQAWNAVLAENAREGFAKVDFAGGALIGGTTVDRMEVETGDGAKLTYFIDFETGRILRLDIHADAWAKVVSLYFEDWRKVGGLQRPYRVLILDRDKESLMQTITYEAITRS
jgi:hypothetical protein